MAPFPSPRRAVPKLYVDDSTSGRLDIIWQAFLLGQWENVDAEDAEQLERAYAKGFARFHASVRNQMCSISLDESPWTHTDSSGVSRPIRRWLNRRRSGSEAIPDEVDFLPAGSQYNFTDIRDYNDDVVIHEGTIELKLNQISPIERSNTTFSNAVDIDRIFVWRSNDWHPVSQRQADQIQTNLREGAKVFEIRDGPYEWIVDTTLPESWVQISKITGRRWPLKCQSDVGEDPTPRLLQGSCSSTALGKLGNLLSPRVISAEGDSAIEFSSDVSNRFPNMMLTERLRQEWDTVRRRISISRVGKGCAVNCLDKRELIQAWIESSGRMGLEYMDLIVQSIADIFLKIDLSRNGLIEEAEWMHYWLLEHQAPSFHALTQINEKLSAWLGCDPKVLQKLNQVFSQNACGKDDAQLTAMQMRIAATSWMSELQRSVLGNSKMTKLQIDVAEYLDELTSSEHMLDDDELLSYYDFMNHMLGRREAKVQLYQYDLSRGSAKFFSSMVVGKQLDGIWHTSVVVFDKEYWLGGKVFESEPGTTPFGAPTNIIELPERTMRTKTDFLQFLSKHLAPQFTTETYDVLTHNCNHFSDAATMFLLNMHIPQDVLAQTELMSIDTWTMQLLRPILNCILGRFEATSSTRELDLSALEAKILEPITEGSLVVWEHDKGWTRIARVVSCSPQRETCTLKWLDVLAGQLRTETGVSRCEVQRLEYVEDLVEESSASTSNSMIGGTFGARFQKLTIAC